MPNVPYRVAVAAHAVPLITLPSGLWRLALAAGLPVAEDSVPDWGQGVYVVMLSVVSEALALLTLGLVRSWGEVVPKCGGDVDVRGHSAAELGDGLVVRRAVLQEDRDA
ncbi:hypothetical protein AB0M96_22935, partial [Streptomyces sp. NPDC051098]